MRPVRLVLQGFGSFRDETTFDFEGIDYFALVGPTGNGKSTVLDAIGFALYGKVPRHGDGSAASQIVSLGAVEARVQLVFDIGATRYVAVRTVKLRNDKPKQEVRLESADGAVLAGAVREFNEHIEQLLGMPFEDFTRCVALPQGEFQKFLHEEPKQRRSVLVRLLNLGHYELIGKRARERATQCATTASVLEEQLARETEQQVDTEAVTRQLVSLHALTTAVDAARADDDTAAQRVATADAARAAALSAVTALHGIAVPATLTVYDDQLAAAIAAREAADSALDSARLQVEHLETEHRAALVHGDLGTITHRLARYDELASLDERRAQQRPRVAALQADAEAAVRSRSAAETAHTAALAALEAARTANRAHALRTDLHAGDACPVCEQTIVQLSQRPEPPDFRAAQQSEKTTGEALKHATTAAQTAADAHTKAESQLEALEAQHGAIAAEVGTYPDRDTLQRTASALRAAETQLGAARRDLTVATAAAQKSATAVEAQRSQLAELQRTFDQQRDLVARLDPPARVANDLKASWEALAEWAATAAVEQQRAADAAASEQETLETERLARLQPLRDQANEHAVDAATLADLYSELRVAIASREAALTHAQADAERRRALSDRIAATHEDRQVAELLGQLMRTDQFIDWLIEDALASLVASASHTLLQLSHGQYSLRNGPHADFEIVDHTNADATRPVRSLSGGETFQASLALALALSDQLTDLAAKGAPKLEAIFLDEGFGTLDPESLDTVATTIEQLGTTGRMVGIVTHVRDLAERVPVRFEITKVANRSQVEVVTS